ncbi:MAG: cytochrome c-type biogenesis protein CcmH [Acidobacteriota bacterium]|nr:cytochrome c-type biogenesis protein CcmH [Acidobacteriota bacterium]
MRRTTSHRWMAALLLLSMALLMSASSDSTGQRFDKLGHNLMCSCGCNQVLLECNHVGCSVSEQMRKELKGALAKGGSDKEILAGFVTEYGPTVLAAPTTTGFNRVAWLMPVVIFLAALTAVVLVVRAWKRRAPKEPPSGGDAGGDGSGGMDDFRRRAREETSL